MDAYASGSTAKSAFLGGSDQFAVVNPPTFISATIQGKDPVAIFNVPENLAIVLVASAKDEASRGTDPSKFGGATWCQTSPLYSTIWSDLEAEVLKASEIVGTPESS